MRYEVEWGYIPNAAASDDIRILFPSAPKRIRDLCIEEYWPFDDEQAVIVNFEDDGNYIGSRVVEDREKIPLYIDIMHKTKEATTPLREYLRMVRMGEIEY